jgi:hypothetical protein
MAPDESAHPAAGVAEAPAQPVAAESAPLAEAAPSPEPGPPAPASGPEWYAGITPAPALASEEEASDDQPLTREFLFRKPQAPLTSSFGSSGSGPGRWLAIAFLIVIVLAAFVMFRDVIIQALPALAPIYAAMGLLVHPVAAPHG